MKRRLLTFSLLVLFFPLALMSCMSTRVYVETNDQLYEDDILIQESSSLTRDGKPKKTAVTTYHDLSSAGYIVTNTNGSKITAHSFTATKNAVQGQSYSEVEFSLVETILDTRSNTYTTEVIGKKTARLSKDGSYISSTEGSSTNFFKGDSFSEVDEAFFADIAATTAWGLATGLEEINESSGKRYRTEETIKEITVNSVPNSQYIVYSILGKPFVLLGTGLWNLIKCLGYSFYNFAGGYNLTTGQVSENMPIWLMPSMETAKEKFAAGKEANAIQYYPEYHLPFTDNTITVVTTEQMSNSTFVNEDNAVNFSQYSMDYTNEMSVARSAKADAEYTAGVVGLVGTGLTIPIAGLSWIGGAAVGVMTQIQQ